MIEGFLYVVSVCVVWVYIWYQEQWWSGDVLWNVSRFDVFASPNVPFMHHSLDVCTYGCALPSEVPCKHVVELARAQLERDRNPDAPLREFAAIRPNDAEVSVHRVLQKYKLSPNVKIDFEDLTADKQMKGFPVVRLSSWILFLLETGRCTRQLCGVSDFPKMATVLQEFWKRYEEIEPGHQVFDLARSGQLDLRYTIPYYSHTDEGRSYKHEAIWILSCHGAIGRGTKNYLDKRKHLTEVVNNEMGLNFVGHTMSTHFFIASMLRKTMNSYPGSLSALLGIFADDCAKLATEGVSFGDHRVWLIQLGSKGDLPALCKVGNMYRSYSHVPRASKSKTPSTGICHLCLGGQEHDMRNGREDYPFEDVRVSPSWEPTIHAVPPWHEEPIIFRGLPMDPAKRSGFFLLDLWHCFHLGLAKHYIASSYVLIIESTLLEQRSVETKFGFITEKYQAFCRARKLAMWIQEINRDALNWPQSSTCPVGKWNKGSCSTTMMLFLDYFCKTFISGHTDDPKLLLIVSCLNVSKDCPLFWGYVFQE